MTNEQIVLKEFKRLYEDLENSKFVTDKSGVNCVEIIDSNIKNLDPSRPLFDFGPRKTPENYCKKELDWYLSESLNIKGWMDDIKIWTQVADKDGFINSNYGNLVFSKENFKQYQHVLDELTQKPDSRRALIMYNRPSMWIEYNADGMSDFTCTISAQVFIRDNRLIWINTMRSQDAIFGFGSDFYWACYVYNRLFDDLKQTHEGLKHGWINWNCASFHVYERHFELLKDIIDANKEVLLHL